MHGGTGTVLVHAGACDVRALAEIVVENERVMTDGAEVVLIGDQITAGHTCAAFRRELIELHLRGATLRRLRLELLPLLPRHAWYLPVRRASRREAASGPSAAVRPLEVS